MLSAWIQFERREDELIGVTSLDCCGSKMECPKASLIAGYDPDTIGDRCGCARASED